MRSGECTYRTKAINCVTPIKVKRMIKINIRRISGVMAVVAISALALGVAKWGMMAAQYRRLAARHTAAEKNKRAEARGWLEAGKLRPQVNLTGGSWSSGQDLADWRTAARALLFEAEAHSKTAVRFRQAATRPWSAP